MASTEDKFRKELEKLVKQHGGRGEYILIYPTSIPVSGRGPDVVETIIATNCDRITMASIMTQILEKSISDIPKNTPEGQVH